MKRIFQKLALITAIVLLAGCAADVSCGTASEASQTTFSAFSAHRLSDLPCSQYNAAFTQKQLSAETIHTYETDGQLLGATMPHYQPQLSMGIDLMRQVAKVRQLDTVIIIAPNHAGSGAAFTISGCGYTWANGRMEGDADSAQTLISAVVGEACADEKILSTEYAASVWVPYLASLFPKAQVVTVLVNRGASMKGLSALAETIRRLSEEKEVFVLASVDFSHYQTPQEMQKRDAVTEKTVLSGNLAELRKLDGSYLDCPEAVCVLSMLSRNHPLQKLGHESIVYNENGKATGASYFVFAIEQ